MYKKIHALEMCQGRLRVETYPCKSMCTSFWVYLKNRIWMYIPAILWRGTIALLPLTSLSLNSVNHKTQPIQKSETSFPFPCIIANIQYQRQNQTHKHVFFVLLLLHWFCTPTPFACFSSESQPDVFIVTDRESRSNSEQSK